MNVVTHSPAEKDNQKSFVEIRVDCSNAQWRGEEKDVCTVTSYETLSFSFSAQMAGLCCVKLNCFREEGQIRKV